MKLVNLHILFSYGKKCAISFILISSFHIHSAETKIDWQTISGGGGTSAGGVFTIQGSIGQTTGVTASGGIYAITTGFWSFVGVIQTPGAPILYISGTNQNVILRWKLTEKPYLLEETKNLEHPPIQWTAVDATFQTNQDFINVTLPASQGYKFYRLRQR